jgi:hypothetical protein
VSAPGDYDNGEIGGMIGRGNRSTRRKPAPVPLCPPQTPHAARTRTRALQWEEHVRLSENENIGPWNYALILKGFDDDVLYSRLLSLQNFSLGNILRKHNVQKLGLFLSSYSVGFIRKNQSCSLDNQNEYNYIYVRVWDQVLSTRGKEVKNRIIEPEQRNENRNAHGDEN